MGNKETKLIVHEQKFITPVSDPKIVLERNIDNINKLKKEDFSYDINSQIDNAANRNNILNTYDNEIDILDTLTYSESLIWINKVTLHTHAHIYRVQPKFSIKVSELKKHYMYPNTFIEQCYANSGNLANTHFSLEKAVAQFKKYCCKSFLSGYEFKDESFHFINLIPTKYNIIDIHALLPETLFTCTNAINEYSSKKQNCGLALSNSNTPHEVLLTDTAENMIELLCFIGQNNKANTYLDPLELVTSLSEKGVCCPRSSMRGLVARVIVYLVDMYPTIDSSSFGLSKEELLTWIQFPLTIREIFIDMLNFYIMRNINPLLYMNSKQRLLYAEKCLFR